LFIIDYEEGFYKVIRNIFWKQINKSTFQSCLIRHIKGKFTDADIAPDMEKNGIIKMSEISQGMRQELPLSHTHTHTHTHTLYIYIYIL